MCTKPGLTSSVNEAARILQQPLVIELRLYPWGAIKAVATFALQLLPPQLKPATTQDPAVSDLDDALRRLIQERVDVAQNATKVRCMICGSGGEIDNRPALVCVCREHGSQRDINPWTTARIGL